MKIETKFNIYDDIFFLNNNKKVSSMKIRGVKIHVTSNEIEIVEEVTYLCNNDADARVHIKVLEQDAYSSKKELLKSL